MIIFSLSEAENEIYGLSVVDFSITSSFWFEHN